MMADLSWRHINILCGDTRGLCFRGIQELSTHRVCKEPTNHNLYFFV